MERKLVIQYVHLCLPLENSHISFGIGVLVSEKSTCAVETLENNIL